MTAPKKKRGRKRKRRPNAGSFKPGPDPRRHKLTRADARKGYERALEVMMERGWDAYAWFFRHIRGIYARKRRECHGQEEK